MGADIEEMPDGLIIRGRPLKGAKVFSHHDHRIAFSLAVAALAAEGETVIEDVDCCHKSYGAFAEDFVGLGGAVVS